MEEKNHNELRCRKEKRCRFEKKALLSCLYLWTVFGMETCETWRFSRSLSRPFSARSSRGPTPDCHMHKTFVDGTSGRETCPLCSKESCFLTRCLCSWSPLKCRGGGGQGCFKDRTPSFPWSKLSEFLWGTCLDVRWCAVKECEPCKTKCIRTLWCFTGWTCLAYIWNSDTRRCWVNIDKSNKMSNIQHLAAWTSKVGGVELNHTM